MCVCVCVCVCVCLGVCWFVCVMCVRARARAYVVTARMCKYTSIHIWGRMHKLVHTSICVDTSYRAQQLSSCVNSFAQHGVVPHWQPQRMEIGSPCVPWMVLSTASASWGRPRSAKAAGVSGSAMAPASSSNDGTPARPRARRQPMSGARPVVAVGMGVVEMRVMGWGHHSATGSHGCTSRTVRVRCSHRS